MINKRITLPILMSITVLLITGCITRAALEVNTSTPTISPPIITIVPSETAVPTTQVPTQIQPTLTPTNPSSPLIEHFPTGQEFTVTAIHMVDEITGWAIGGLANNGDHILKTEDGGAAWKDLTPPEAAVSSGEQKNAIGYFQDAVNAWVVYGYSVGSQASQVVVWRTQDGGATWQASQALDITDLSEIFMPSDLQFVDGTNGWLLVHVGVGMNHDYVVLYRSADGGLTWERLIDPYNDTSNIMGCSKTSMLFTDTTHGWLTGDCHGVAAGVLLFKTADAGATWEKVTLPEPTSYPGLFSNDAMVACGSYDPFFFGNDFGHLNVKCQDYQGTQITYSYYIYTTQDFGDSWTSSVYPGESVYFLNADNGWALSKKIHHTTDGGLTWTAISDVTWSAKVDFINDNIGWAIATAGDQAALVKTVNGGAEWTELTPTVIQ